MSCKSNDCLVFDTSCSRVELDRLYVFNAMETQSGILDKGKLILAVQHDRHSKCLPVVNRLRPICFYFSSCFSWPCPIPITSYGAFLDKHAEPLSRVSMSMVTMTLVTVVTLLHLKGCAMAATDK